MRHLKKRTYRNNERRARMTPPHAFLHSLSPEARQGIAVVFVLMLVLLSGLSLAGLAGAVGETLDGVFGFLFGSTKYGVPIFILLGGIFFIRRAPLSAHVIQFIGFVFFILSFTAFWHLPYPVEESFSIAREGMGGGVAGFFLAYSLQSILQFWGALIVVLSIFLIASFIMLNASLGDLLMRIAAGGAWAREWFFGMMSWLRIPRTARSHEEQEGRADIPAFSRGTLPVLQKPEKERVQEEPVSKHQDEIEIIKAPKRKSPIQIPLDLLSGIQGQPTSGDIKLNKLVIQKTLENFGIPVEMGEINVGPTVTQYTLKPAEGIKLATITGLHNDLALSLAAHPIRIEAPIPGKALVGIEVPNQKVARVTLRELLCSEQFRRRKSSFELALGKDVSGTPRIVSLPLLPHLLIAGSTGSGKTVCINTIIATLLYQNGPDTLRFILIDPKRVELPCYNDIPHLLTPVVTDVKKTLNALRWALGEMDRRFDLLSKAGKRDLRSFNESQTGSEEKVPMIVIVIDELADIMATVGAEAETLIIRLAQMARAVGIHLILATQRPSVDVITGLIKANITARIAFAVASQMDSRTILDTAGAERLIGRGDMLFISADLSKPVRLQGAYLSDEEIERVVTFLKSHGEPSYHEGVVERTPHVAREGLVFNDEEDDLLPEAREMILQSRKASASFLQRRFRIGYARAARLLDLLEAEGFIGPGDGAKPRQILVGATAANSDDTSADDEPLDGVDDTAVY